MEYKIRPILFSTPMVQALLNGTKSQTRREATPRDTEATANMINLLAGANVEHSREQLLMRAPYQINDILWVRESWNYDAISNVSVTEFHIPTGVNCAFVYKAENPTNEHPEFGKMKWRPSIHMPKKACRIFLKITDVRIHCLQDITADDAAEEGLEAINEDYHSEPGAVHADYKNYLWKDDEGYEDFIFPYYADPTESFRSLWQSINGKESWQRNPLVWAITFEVCQMPENFLSC